MSDRFRVVVAERLPEESLAELRRVAELTVFDQAPEPARLHAAVAPAHGLIVRSGTKVNRELVSLAPELRVIGRAGVGVDNIDLDAATERGIVVVNVADGNSVAVAEHVFGLLLALVRSVVPAHLSVAEGRWERSRFVGEELRGKELGLVGLGRIGLEVAARAAAFGMRVLAHDPYVPGARAQSLGVELTDLPDLLERADVVSIHTPLTPETRHLIDSGALGRMKPTAYLINCARGGIVDESALVAALESGRLAGAAVDVFEHEPPGDHPLRRLPNVVLSPHLGGSTRQAQDYNARAVADQVARVLRGQPARGAVNVPRLSDEDWSAVEPLLPLAEILGLVYREGLGGPLEALEVRVRARDLLSPRAVELLAGAAMKGLLEGIVEGPVNVVNALFIASRRGLEVRRSSATDSTAARPILELSGGGAPRRRVSGTLALSGAPRLVELDDLPIDMAPSGHLLLTRHRDRPGMVARVAGILGRFGVNIASMQVARREVRGEAIMALVLDDPVPREALFEIRGSHGIEEARAVLLPDAGAVLDEVRPC